MPPSDDLTDVELHTAAADFAQPTVRHLTNTFALGRRAVAELRRLRAEAAVLKGDRCPVCDEDGLIYITVQYAHDGEGVDERPEACPCCGGTKSGYASLVTKERDEARADLAETRACLATAREELVKAWQEKDAAVEERTNAFVALQRMEEKFEESNDDLATARLELAEARRGLSERGATEVRLLTAPTASPAPLTVTAADLRRLHGLAEDMVDASRFDGHETLASRAMKLVDDVLVDLRATVVASPAPLTVAEDFVQVWVERFHREVQSDTDTAEDFVRSLVASVPYTPPAGLPPFCEGCGSEIDPTTCGCGDYMDGYHEGHSAVPMGCNCCRAETDWGEVAKGLRERLRAERVARTTPIDAPDGGR